jgi:hypothetical protein
MRSTTTVIFLTLIVITSCSDNTSQTTKLALSDTTVRKIIVAKNNDKIGEAIYFLVYSNDTSTQRCYFSQDSNEVAINIYDDNDLSYREEKNELKLILREASKDFRLDLLNKIWDVPLIATGDLAITITKQLPSEYLERSLSNFDVANFLLTSKLTDDLNELLMPYGKKIQKCIVEKAGFIDSSVILKNNKIETPKSEIPSKILDAQVWPVIENSGG